MTKYNLGVIILLYNITTSYALRFKAFYIMRNPAQKYSVYFRRQLKKITQKKYGVLLEWPKRSVNVLKIQFYRDS